MANQNFLFLYTFLVFATLTTGSLLKSESSTTLAELKGSHQNFSQTSAILNSLSTNVSCSSDWNCHKQVDVYSTCYKNLCICNIGYHFLNEKCVHFYCRQDSDCTALYANTKCELWGWCVCDTGTHKDFDSQTCYYPSYGLGTVETIAFSIGGFLLLLFIIFLFKCFCQCQGGDTDVALSYGSRKDQYSWYSQATRNFERHLQEEQYKRIMAPLPPVNIEKGIYA